MPDPQQHYSNSVINMPISTISSLTGPTTSSPANSGSRSVDPRNLSYDKTTIEEIIVRQLNEDIQAYKFDLDFCNQQMKASDITPQEMRTLQLRVLDLTHSMRHSQHRIEQLQFEMGNGGTGASASGGAGGGNPSSGGGGVGNTAPTSSASSLGKKALAYAHHGQATDAAFSTFPRPDGAVAIKRSASTTGVGYSSADPVKRARTSDIGTPSGGGRGGPRMSPGSRNSPANSAFFSAEDDDDEMQRTMLHGNNVLQRLGYWKCRLCTSQKYMANKNSRQPAAPCKWPLKDVAKMIAHFMELHTEHEPGERCMELGTALDRNRGPFQYWLTRSHSQDLGDGSAINDVIETLYAGQLPNMLRKLSRAAATFPGQQ
ncbi:hypothetical protein MKZ38_002586 [Zalerion maritima]|uniref:Uncharacterized protein n=1 Tax=Zalerion maritima TaxID=339359 RepID=A0AAD5WQP2_9PEZI|nr:hypothetical protein MKZ38_002586 [Zalerion maritima]